MPVMVKIAVKAAVNTSLILINSAQKHDPEVVMQVGCNDRRIKAVVYADKGLVSCAMLGNEQSRD